MTQQAIDELIVT